MQLDVLFVHDMVLMDDKHMVRYNQVDEVDYNLQFDRVDDLLVQDLFEGVQNEAYVHCPEEDKIQFPILELLVLKKKQIKNIFMGKLVFAIREKPFDLG